MTLENTLRQQLNNPQSGGFQVSHGDWTVFVAVDKMDSLSCALKELSLKKATSPTVDVDSWATRVAAKATGLLEPLRLIETDRTLAKALLRSATPSVQDGKALYYELVLEASTHATATLHRYAGQHGEKREAISFVLTHDAIVKLVADIAA